MKDNLLSTTTNKEQHLHREKSAISSISASPYFASQACFVSPSQRLNAFNMHAIATLTWNQAALKCLFCYFVENISIVRNYGESIKGCRPNQQTLYSRISQQIVRFIKIGMGD